MDMLLTFTMWLRLIHSVMVAPLRSVHKPSIEKQASRPILVRGLRQDLTEYFFHEKVKVSVAQLVE